MTNLDLPVNREFYELLDAVVYHRSNSRIVALCVVKSRFKTEIKLYEWVLRDGKGWRVSLANLSLADLDLKRMAADAERLATVYKVKLNWVKTSEQKSNVGKSIAELLT